MIFGREVILHRGFAVGRLQCRLSLEYLAFVLNAIIFLDAIRNTGKTCLETKEKRICELSIFVCLYLPECKFLLVAICQSTAQ